MQDGTPVLSEKDQRRLLVDRGVVKQRGDLPELTKKQRANDLHVFCQSVKEYGQC